MSTTTVSYNLINALTCCLKRYTKFEGRASRSEFWYWVLSTFIIGFVIGFVGVLTVGEEVTNVILNILQLALLLPGLAVAVRRLHDTGRSGWNLLWTFLPLIGAIILIIFYCQASREANQYGEGPASPEA
ncbi:MAG: DUF805 domain-containing protein [Akkermansia sp.]|nr:DUF805 domain-containing protein [Akkermansia sp.]